MNCGILSDLIITKVHSVSTLYTEKGTGAKRQNRSVWALIIKYEGETVYTSGEKKYISNINNIAVLPKGSSYEWFCTKSGHFSTIEFECEKTYHGIFSFGVKNSEFILNAVRKSEINRTLKKTAYMLDELKDLYGILSYLLKSADSTYVSSDKKNKILPAIRYIAENYNKPLCNDDLAAAAGLSTVYFRKLFREVMGISPVSYVKNLKMNKACKMLKCDYSSITDIAYSLGYGNVYEFSRDFKKTVGIPPSKYAKQK